MAGILISGVVALVTLLSSYIHSWKYRIVFEGENFQGFLSSLENFILEIFSPS